jgi:CRISPR-associated protein (TIGR03986 family)
MISGILVVEGKVLKVKFTNLKGKEVSFLIPQIELATSISDKKENGLAGLNGLVVDLEVVGGQPCQVRPQGEVWKDVVPEQQNKNRRDNNQDRRGNNNNYQTQNQTQNYPAQSINGDFHNPYNFVPALPRNKIPADNELGDRQPVGHDRYLPGYWSGNIQVKLTTKTPLLIPDASRMTSNNDHKTYPMRILDDKPYLPPTSIKGMLRAAYEAVTNSRLSVFVEHDDRLFYRMSAGEGLSLVPAIVEGNRLKLMRGSTNVYPKEKNGRWNIPNNLMYAAWLPSYHRNPRNNLAHPNLQHGDRVRVWIEQYQKKDQYEKVMFKHWRVLQIVPFDRTLGTRPNPGTATEKYSPVENETIIKVEGYLCITGKNIKGKHDERVFFNISETEDYQYSLTELSQDWEYLIKDYQQLHENEKRDEGLEWSRQVIGGDQEFRLVDPNRPTLCYAFVDTNDGKNQITALYPVMISRAIYDLSPSEILSPNDDSNNLKPATSIDKLSPADRVFGWVNQNGNGAYRGNLRISDVQCKTPDPIQDLGIGLPLAILGQPQPQQGRFYAAKDNKGTPVDKGISKQELYQENQGLRGRKVYPHNKNLPANYWDNPLEDRTQTNNAGTFQEYRRPRKAGAEQQDNQNRSITAWVKPDVTFEFKIEVTNLSSVELGALLWLLALPENYFHRLGGAKPLGFGSVTLAVDWDRSSLQTGDELKQFYSSLIPSSRAPTFNCAKSIDDFKQAVKEGYQKEFAEVTFIKAFCQAAQGFSDGKPIHYPRINAKPDPDGKSFEWFTNNEVPKKERLYALGALINDGGLPILS